MAFCSNQNKCNLIKSLIFIFYIYITQALSLSLTTHDRPTLRIPLQVSAILFDPSGVQDTQSIFVSRQISCQLIRNQGYYFELEAAESVKYITPLKIVITLKKDVLFHDGTLVKSQDVISSLDYIRKSRHVFQNLFSWIDNIETKDDRTIIFISRKNPLNF